MHATQAEINGKANATHTHAQYVTEADFQVGPLAPSFKLLAFYMHKKTTSSSFLGRYSPAHLNYVRDIPVLNLAICRVFAEYCKRSGRQ